MLTYSLMASPLFATSALSPFLLWQPADHSPVSEIAPFQHTGDCFVTDEGDNGGGGSADTLNTLRTTGGREKRIALTREFSGHWTEEGFNLGGRSYSMDSEELRVSLWEMDRESKTGLEAEIAKTKNLLRELEGILNIASGELKQQLDLVIDSLNIYEARLADALEYATMNCGRGSEVPPMTYEEVLLVLQRVRQKQQLPAYIEWQQMLKRDRNGKKELMRIFRGIKEEDLPLESDVIDRISKLNDELRRLKTSLPLKEKYVKKLWAAINGIY